jgi:hypothetical protein
MAQSLNIGQLVVSPAPYPGASDAYFDTLLAYTLASGGTQVVPVGVYWLKGAANLTTQIQLDSTGTNWVTALPASTGGVIISDGTNVRLVSGATGVIADLLPKK